MTCGKDFIRPDAIEDISEEKLAEIREAAQMARNGND